MIIPDIPVNIISGTETFNYFKHMLNGSLVLYSNSCKDFLKHSVPFFSYAVKSMPSQEDVDEVKSHAKDCKEVVAVGGGSVIDVGKLVAKDLGGRLIVFPSLSGSGSEVTQYAVLWDREKCKKLSFKGEELYPKIAVLDPLLQLNVPMEQRIISISDAMCHAYEAQFHKDASSRVVRYVITALEFLGVGVRELMNTFCFPAIDCITMGSLFAGAAMSLTSTTVCHAVSYPLTVRFGMPHGIATNITLPYFLSKISDNKVNYSYMDGIFEEVGIKYKLSDYGVSSEDLQDIVNEAFEYGKMDRVIFEVDKNELVEALEERL